MGQVKRNIRQVRKAERAAGWFSGRVCLRVVNIPFDDDESTCWPTGEYEVSPGPNPRLMPVVVEMPCRCGGCVVSDGGVVEGGVLQWCGCQDVDEAALLAFERVWAVAMDRHESAAKAAAPAARR